ncbi:response regulator [Anaerolineales bacterium HSG6]|nr:response regulator [Anaerolineales bacterium HSG6]MDM8531966.1 response regulator [Anaerolineales bacterium HSG25]
MAGENVLVIDDRKDNRKFLREYILEPNGYKTIEGAHGIEGLKMAMDYQPDLIISDIMMPKMGGLELLDTLRQEGVNIPTILMTFHGSEETAVQAFRLGAQNYIIKPFAIEEMLTAIDRALTESRLREERDELTQTLLGVNQQLEGRLEELRFLYGIGRSVTSLQDIEPILNRIVEAAVYLTKAEEGSLMLLDPTSGELYLRAARNIGDKRAKSFRVKVNDSLAGQVVRTGRPVMIGGSNQDDSFKVMTGYFVKALLNVPLKVGNQVIGVLAINNKSEVRAFDQSHLHSLTALANYASIAIENARLYAKVTSEAAESSRELEEAIEARNTELQQLNLQLLKTEKLAALGYMAAGIARAVDRPINLILSNLDTLTEHNNNLEDKELLVSLAKEAFHCRKITRNLLDFSGQREYHPEQTDLNRMIKQTWSNYVKDHKNDKVKVIPQLSPKLPKVWVDRSQMQQSLLYLVRNAYRSMNNGGTFRIVSRYVDSEVQVIFSNTGAGMSQKDLQHIFDPFYETENRTYGLDLSVVHGIITRHKGKINVESQPGRGTTFIITLPKSVVV